MRLHFPEFSVHRLANQVSEQLGLMKPWCVGEPLVIFWG